jgi:hypothetical protein
VHEPTDGMVNATVCRACDWRSEDSFISFEEYARDKDFAATSAVRPKAHRIVSTGTTRCRERRARNMGAHRPRGFLSPADWWMVYGPGRKHSAMIREDA